MMIPKLLRRLLPYLPFIVLALALLVGIAHIHSGS